ncbi:guanine nucleotide exchange factor VAV3 [Pristis pectinata]|uniref:guanine nucleotide exchange factor VAV3 n=1 Tax=Pristis pectinata TaxID=685728 RepID=UPI00223C94F7|nr:guanine nucleotide exchange factor VAV3 [Pristis pectinata]
MELWRQCTIWLAACGVLPPGHRLIGPEARLFELAQGLRDGVLLCRLLGTLRPGCISSKHISQRPHMSQFLCLKNIRTFLSTCCDTFGMRRSDLFDAFDLFDVRDFAKVIDTLSRLSHTAVALSSGVRPFPTEESDADEDIYRSLADLIDEESVEDDEDLYDCVYGDDEGGEVYEDLMKVEAAQPARPTESDIRTCCLLEIKQTEEKYTETLESIEKYFMGPLRQHLTAADMETIFINMEALVNVHRDLNTEVKSVIMSQNHQTLYQVFLKYKERLLIYGEYCSKVEDAIKCLDEISKSRQDLRLKFEECARRANNGKFTLRDLLVVPMQRVLKYHLLLQELAKQTTEWPEKANLRLALDAMKDLAQYVNEVKRDSETLREIAQFQHCIDNMNQPLEIYGRPKVDGELRILTLDKRGRQDRYAFLFDKAVIVCKRRGDNYEMKEIIDLNSYKITNNPTTDKENKKWSHGFYLTHLHGHNGFEFFCKTKELKKKWLEQFAMALSNIRPEHSDSNEHSFTMYTFDQVTVCSACRMLLRGTFYQGYLCMRCGTGAHKECLGRIGVCSKAEADPRRGKQMNCFKGDKKQGSTLDMGTWIGKVQKDLGQVSSGLPRMQVTRCYEGTPQPPHTGPALTIQQGDVIEVHGAEAHSIWWKGRNLTTREEGFFPRDCVKPLPCVPKRVDYSGFAWFAGAVDRLQAEAELINRGNSTFLVRQRPKELEEFAISINYNNEVKHIKIISRDSSFYIAQNKRFHTLQELVDYYSYHSLKEGFRCLDTTLQIPYKIPEGASGNRAAQSAGLFVRPKVVGVAVAQYDFSARDMRELSLQEGDVVTIHSKTGPNGWWRGSVNGRIGWFPSTYVEEEDCFLY